MIGMRAAGTLVMAALVPSMAMADHGYQYARVLSSDPIYETVTYYRPVEQCRDEPVAYRERRGYSATAPILGAIIGGALGNAVGHHKRNKQVGVVVGAVLGGSIGADVARRRSAEIARRTGRYDDDVYYATRQVCSVAQEQRQEDRLVGYRVTYRYGGETYSTDMDHDPGDTLRVRVRVTPVG